MNKQRKCYRPWQTAVLAFVFTLLSNLPVQADDTEVYFGAGSSQTIRPNVLFIMDTSGSMRNGVSGDPEGRDRLEVMQDSLLTVLDSISNVNVGLMRYSSPDNYDNNGGPILFPVRHIDAGADSAIVISQVKKPTASGATPIDNTAPIDSDPVYVTPTDPDGTTPTETNWVASDDAVEYSSGTVVLNGTSIVVGGTDSTAGPSGIHESSWGQDTDFIEDIKLGDDYGSTLHGSLGKDPLGFRFPGIAIRPGMVIDSAHLLMRSSRVDGPGAGYIKIESDPNPPTYSVENGLMTRNYRSENVPWRVEAGGAGIDYTSPDIASLVQLAINDPGWNENQALAFYMEPAAADSDFGSGTDMRNFCTPGAVINDASCDGGAPVLSISWHDPNEAPNQSQKAGLRFENILVPQGATILRAFIDFMANEDSTGTADYAVQAHRSTDSPTFSAATNSISLRGLTTAVADWGNVQDWQDEENYRSADLSAVVEEVVAEPGWCGGNAMSFVISGTGSRSFVTADGDPGSAPKLVIEFDQASALGGCTQGSVVKQIGHENDDADSREGPEKDELKFENERLVGFRFTEVGIPPGAQILSAQIELTAKNDKEKVMETRIYAIDDANPDAFSSKELSGMQGTSYTAWSSADWVKEEKKTTSDIKLQVQEIVDKPDWVAGNAMGFIIEVISSDKPEAFSYDKSPGQSAKLFIDYRSDFHSGSITVRKLLKNTVASFTHDGYTPIAGTLAEAARYFRGEGVKFGRTRGAPASLAKASFRTSHPFSHTGGTHVLPDGCPEWDSNDSDCAAEEIAGSPVYISPIADHCQPSHLLFLSDGQPNSFGSNTANMVAAMTGESCQSYDSGKNCSLELAHFLANKDQSPDHAGGQVVITSTVSFAENIPLMEALAFQGGGEFYQANNEAELVAALEQFIESALDTTSSFVSAGVSVNQFNRLTNDEELYFSLFQPSASTVWPGNLKRYRYDPETDTVVDVKGKTAILAGQFNAEAYSFWNDIKDGKDVSQGGAAYKMPDYRKVYSNVTADQALTNSSNWVIENNSAITQEMLGVADSISREKVLKWARGVDVNDSDGDSSDTDARLQMGDPLHSRPMLIKYDGGDGIPSADDSAVVMIGTNQGYLHAINASDGDNEHLDDGNELWAFVPKDLLGNLVDYQQNTPGVTRPYGLDGQITINHTDTDKDGLVDDGEQVILYVGMRRGGRNYYALDVSDKLAPRLLFEIKGGTGDYAELGQSWSAAMPITIKWNGAAKKAIVFGGGYDVTQDTADTVPVADAVGRTVFVADALTGALLWDARIHAKTPAAPFPGSSAATATLTASITGNIKAIDFDNDGFTDTLYATDTNAQVFRFDIDQAANLPANFAVGGRIAHLSEDSVAGNRRFYYAADPALVVLNNNNRFVAVSVGSGYRAHPLNQATEEHFYVLRDYGVLENTFDADISLSDLADVSEAATNESAQLLIDASNGKGWMINLSNPNVGKPGEKVTAPSLTVNNTVVFSTYIPPAASLGACAPSEGTGRTWFVDILDGTPTEERAENLDNPQLSDRHTPENIAGLPPGAIPFYTEKGLILLEGRNVLEAPTAPEGDPLNVFRRREGRRPLAF